MLHGRARPRSVSLAPGGLARDGQAPWGAARAWRSVPIWRGAQGRHARRAPIALERSAAVYRRRRLSGFVVAMGSERADREGPSGTWRAKGERALAMSPAA